MTSLAALVTQAIDLSGATSDVIAVEANVSRNMIARYRYGTAQPQAATVARILDACGFDLVLAPAKRKGAR